MTVAARILVVLNRKRGGLFDRHELEDLSQDAVALAWSRLDTFTGGSALETWLYSFCVNTLANALRKRAVRQRQMVMDAPGEAPPPQVHDDIHAAMMELRPEVADIVRMRVFEERSFSEIASRFRHPVPTVKAWFYRGLKRLASVLGGENEE